MSEERFVFEVDKLWSATSCGDKVAFSTRRQAVKARTEAENRTGEVLKEYKCLLCSKWHFGHENKRNIEYTYDQRGLDQGH